MRVAIISDIHGNRVALEDVMRAIELEVVDEVICLGDVAATGPNPHEVVEKLSEKNVRCVLGNHEESLLKSTSVGSTTVEGDILGEIDSWCAHQLTQSDMDFLRGFKATLEIPLGEDRNLLAFHGSPRSSTEFIRSTARDEELEEIFSGFKATVMAGGHMHRQMFRQFRNSLLINPGSVGLPYERDRSTGKLHTPALSEFAIIASGESGLNIELRRVKVDFNNVVSAIVGSKMPYKEVFLQTWERTLEKLLVQYNLI